MKEGNVVVFLIIVQLTSLIDIIHHHFRSHLVRVFYLLTVNSFWFKFFWFFVEVENIFKAFAAAPEVNYISVFYQLFRFGLI